MPSGTCCKELEKGGSAAIIMAAMCKDDTTVEAREMQMHEIMQEQGSGLIDDPGRS
jgi:hypothetical protein